MTNLGRAAGEAARGALTDADANKALAESAKETPEFKIATREYAKRQAMKQMAITGLFSNLAALVGIRREYYDSQFALDLMEAIGDVDPEELQEPKANIAAPAMQALGYSLDEPELKQMYLNLLATATKASSHDDAHPSFTAVIEQLDGYEAGTLTTFIRERNIAVVKAQQVEGAGYSHFYRNLTDPALSTKYGRTDVHLVPTYIDNWVRLRLFELDQANHFLDDRMYAWADEREDVVATRAEGLEIEMGKGVLWLTDFGERFARAIGAIPTADLYLLQAQGVELPEEPDPT